MNTYFCLLSFFFPSNKNTPLLPLSGESEVFFFLSSVRGFNQYFSTSLRQDCAHHPAPFPIRLSYPPGHYECFGSGHLIQVGPIRILWNFFFLSSSMGKNVSLCCEKTESNYMIQSCWFSAHYLEKLELMRGKKR